MDIRSYFNYVLLFVICNSLMSFIVNYVLNDPLGPMAAKIFVAALHVLTINTRAESHALECSSDSERPTSKTGAARPSRNQEQAKRQASVSVSSHGSQAWA